MASLGGSTISFEFRTQEVVGEAVLVEITPATTFDGFFDWFVVVVLEIERDRDERVIGAEELPFLDD